MMVLTSKKIKSHLHFQWWDVIILLFIFVYYNIIKFFFLWFHHNCFFLSQIYINSESPRTAPCHTESLQDSRKAKLQERHLNDSSSTSGLLLSQCEVAAPLISTRHLKPTGFTYRGTSVLRACNIYHTNYRDGKGPTE